MNEAEEAAAEGRLMRLGQRPGVLRVGGDPSGPLTVSCDTAGLLGLAEEGVRAILGTDAPPQIAIDYSGPSGRAKRARFDLNGSSPSHRSVSTGPGLTVFTRIFLLPRSNAR